jgi:hypothetical protein
MPHRVKPKMIAYHPCQIALYQKLSHNFKKWCNFQVTLKEICIKQDLSAFKISLSMYENWTAQSYTLWVFH